MGLSVAEQGFMQSMMAAKAVNTEKAIEMYNEAVDRAKVSNKIRDGHELELKIDRINTELRSLEFQFRTSYSCWEQEKFWGLCNTIEDEAVRCATYFKDNVRTYFFSLCEELRDSDGEMTLTDAQNMGTECGLNVKSASEAIQKFQKGQWLKIMKREDHNAMLIFGARSLLELSKVRAWNMKRSSKVEQAGGALQLDAASMQDEQGSDDAQLVQEDSEEEIEPVRRRASSGRRGTSTSTMVADTGSDLESVAGGSRRRKYARRASQY